MIYVNCISIKLEERKEKKLGWWGENSLRNKRQFGSLREVHWTRKPEF